MASLYLPTPADQPGVEAEVGTRNRRAKAAPEISFVDMVVVGFGTPFANDYAEYAAQNRMSGGRIPIADLSSPTAISELKSAVGNGSVSSLIVFLNLTPSVRERQELDKLLNLAVTWQLEFLGIVSSHEIHLGNKDMAHWEAEIVERAQALRVRPVIFRPGHIISKNSSTAGWFQRYGFSYPLVPRRFRGCCVDGDELFGALEEVQRCGEPFAPRVYTLLGPNRPWRDWLAKYRDANFFHTMLTIGCAFLALLGLGQLAGLVFSLLSRHRPSWRRLTFDTLYPRSFGELLALYNPFNYLHLKVVGYNNGVVHFGQRFPGKTIISTMQCNRVAVTGNGMLKADCGATVRKVRDFVAAGGRELPVMPNYSYVCLGTAFFIPIHGSAGIFSTIADTITRVVLYDPVADRVINAARDKPLFQDHVFNLTADVLLLRLHLQLKPKSRYFVRKEVLRNPTGASLLQALCDKNATNVEIRKGQASSELATVSRYYTNASVTTAPLLELPRDTLGRLWDRLEENAVTSFLMHALTRHFAWHLELFFTAEEFEVFWETHRTLPLRKIQLRYIRRDGLPHSPFRDHDCVAIDLFMFRRHRRRFENYLKKQFAVIRSNPGKHSG